LESVIIGFDEPRYYLGIALTILFFLGLLAVIRRLQVPTQFRIIEIIGLVCIASSLAIHPILAFSDDLQWTIQKALPLHLCGFNYLLIGVNCFFRKRWIWEINLFLGIIGGFHSLITPELAQGDSPYFLAFYYFEHGVLFFIPIYFYSLFEYRLDRKSWIRVFLYTNAFALIIFTVNWAINTYIPSNIPANYFYLWEPPEANNPIIQGNWPWYLIPCQVALLLHLFIIQWIFDGWPLRRSARIEAPGLNS
jgi:hypothetical integral membrane protein (TIGR02206 family)